MHTHIHWACDTHGHTICAAAFAAAAAAFAAAAAAVCCCREVARSQPLFDFFTGGRPNAQYGPWIKLPKNRPGFVKCTVVLQGEYKWMGLNGKVYR